jgi:predicted HAD superfamily Cof-like phosphohydrolase
LRNLTSYQHDKQPIKYKCQVYELNFPHKSAISHKIWRNLNLLKITKITMQAIDCLNQVAEFHHTFKAPILDKPQIPDSKRANLRYDLLAEELREFKEAIDNNDLIEAADALCDIQYVLAGAVLEFGLGEKFVELFNEVQRSNMSKACASLTEAQDTVAYYAQKDGTKAYIQEDKGKYLVFRTSDQKVLKSINYSAADLKSIIST